MFIVTNVTKWMSKSTKPNQLFGNHQHVLATYVAIFKLVRTRTQIQL